MKLNKREVCAVLERDYVLGNRSLASIADQFNCSTVRLAQLGREFVEGWAEAGWKRLSFGNEGVKKGRKAENFGACA